MFLIVDIDSKKFKWIEAHNLLPQKSEIKRIKIIKIINDHISCLCGLKYKYIYRAHLKKTALTNTQY